MKYWRVFKKSVRQWQKDKAGQLAAATAYYTVFSLAPLLLIVISLLGLFVGRSAVQQQVVGQMDALLGAQGGQAVRAMIDAAGSSSHSVLAAVIGFVILLLGATGLMSALQDAFNFIWKVETKKTANAIWIMILKRIFSVGLILTIGFLLLVSLVVSALMLLFMQYLSAHFPGLAALLPLLNFTLSFLVIFLLFAILLKYLPDVLLPWNDVWIGAALTSLFFTIGKSVLGIYLGRKDSLSAYGAAGSLVVLLLWVNYSAQILFFGVEFTKAHALEHARLIHPRGYAQFTEPIVLQVPKPSAGKKAGAALRFLFVELEAVQVMLVFRQWLLRRKKKAEKKAA